MARIGIWLRRSGWALALLGLLVAAAWWGLPALLTAQLPPRLSQALGRPVTLDAVEFQPWQLALTLRGLRIGAAGEPAAAAAAPALLQIERLRADLSIASLRRRAPVVEALDIDGLRLNLARTAPGHYDIDDLIERLVRRNAPAAGGEPPRFSLNNLNLRDAGIRFDDRPAGRVHELKSLTLGLPFLSNLPEDIAVHTEPRLAFELNGTRFDTGAQALPFAESRSGRLALAFEDLDLAPLLGYLPAGLPLKPTRARLSSDLALRFSLPHSGEPSVSLTGRLALNDVVLAEPGGAAVAGWQALTLPLTDLQLLQRRVVLGAVTLAGADLRLARDAGGRISLQRLLAPGPATAPRPPATAPAPAPADWTLELARLQVSDARLRWTDDAVRPQAALQVDALGLELDGLRWPNPLPLPLAVRGELRAQRDGAPKAGSFAIEGQVHPSQASLALQLDALELAALGPYLAQALRPQLSGQLAARARLEWAADPARLALRLDSASLQNLQLRDGPASPAGRLASLRRLSLERVDADVPARRLTIGRLELVDPVLRVGRDAERRIDLLQWLADAPSRSSAPAGSRAGAAAAGRAAAQPPWRVALRDLSLSGGQLLWRDAGVGDKDSGAPVQAKVERLTLRLRDLVWPAPAAGPGALARMQLSARIGAPPPPGQAAAFGEIAWDGRVGLAPLQADGRLVVDRFPVHLFVPYAGDALPLRLVHADAGFRGRLRVQAAPAGWSVDTDADVRITDLQLNGRPSPDDAATDGSELLSWQSLSLQGLSLALAPPSRPRLLVREVMLDDFYSRLQITPRGRLNLQDVAARPAGAASAPAAAAAPVVAAAVAATPEAAASAPESERLGAAIGRMIELDIGGIALRNGRIDFSDYFIRPNYSTRLTGLNGSIGRLRSGTREMASLSLRGRAAETALLDISGELNPTADPLALDIRARATDLELAPLSPYAGKYAGYGIERGKLSVDVAYKIDADGRLEAKNQVVLNQLTFGERVESPSATQLPVLLAVALLKDRNGVIDVNLPISGSVSDPKFSVGGIVWQVIGNLLTKAVTAPFSLLAGGSGKDLSQVEFQGGTARLTDGGRQSLAKVATALADRPSLIMTVTGMADPVAEREAAQREALESRLQAERRRELLREAPAAARPPAAAASAPPADEALSAADRARLLERVYKQTPLPNKPRNALGLQRDLPPAEMQALLQAAVPVDEVTMRELALQRGLAVRDALIAAGLANERLFLAAPQLHAPDPGGAAWVPMASLTLSTR
ncbi:MAG: DUF748 domain-containing protein [Burkholderiaceae bacterium]|nr:DUF748 domain-containing protein [Burkholderiaceae bacterium]